MATERDRTPLLPLTPPSSTHQTTIVLCDYGGSILSQRTRRSGSGKTTVRMTMDIKAEPLVARLNGVELGRGPSEAIRLIMQEQTRAIRETAAPATIRRRERAAKELSGGGSTRRLRGASVSSGANVRARYIAARTANNRPGFYNTIGNDSGLLANGFFVTQNPKEGSWTINVAANRLDPKTWNGDLASLQAWVARYVQLMPALRDPRSILTDRRFVEAVMKAPTVVKLTKGNMQRLKELLGLVNQTIGGVEGLTNRLG